MQGTAWEWVIAGVYVLLGPVFWIGFACMMGLTRKQMDLFRTGIPELPPNPPTATILIPVKDEVRRIEACVLTALRQDYPNFDVLVVDDRSHDGTSEVLDALAARESNLRVIHLRDGDLPAGWFGKSHALHVGSQQARGEWMLFFDSDVLLEPSALRAVIALGEQKKYDLISLLPRIEHGSFWEGLIIPLCGGATAAMFAVSLTNVNDRPKIAFATGQFLAMRRSTYDAIGGHASVRSVMAEDLHIARRVKGMGLRPRISIGTDFCSVRMYDTTAQIFRGWSRNFYADPVGRLRRPILGVAFMLACCFSVYAALAWGIYRQIHPVNALGGIGWLAGGAIHLIVMTICLAILYHWSGNPRRYALLSPIGLGALLVIFIRSFWLAVYGKVEWRGTAYTNTIAPATSPMSGATPSASAGKP